MTTIPETKSPIHPNLSAPYLGDLMNQLDHALSQTTPAQDTTMTLTEIAQTFPPMHRWTREQERTVAKAINAIIGQTFICNHPNMQGVETTVVEHHPHSSGCTLELHSPSRSTHQNHSCDVFHFVEYYTPKQDKPMPIDVSFQQFLWAFDTESKAIAYIEKVLAEGRIEGSERTRPYYTCNESALPPRFIAYADHQPQTHSFEIRIERWYEDDDGQVESIVTFDRTDGGYEWFLANLHHTLDGIIEQSEMHWEDTPQAHRMREIGALQLQRASYEQRIVGIRRRLIENGAVLSPAQFEQNCKDVVDLRNKSKHASERIETLFQ